MLVLKRKEGESIIIGGNILVKVHKVEGRAVKLAIEAPKEITIIRAELIEKSKEKVRSSVIIDERLKEFLQGGVKIMKKKVETE